MGIADSSAVVSIVVVATVLAGSAQLAAQRADRRTLRQEVVECQCSVSISIIGQHPITLFSALLDSTDLIVRGRIGSAHSRLSDDETDIHTTFEILEPNVLFSARPQDFENARESGLSITLHGGSVWLVGFTPSIWDHDEPVLNSGDDVILCLRTDGGRPRLAMFGAAFAVANDRIQLLGEGPNERELYAGREVGAFISELVTWKKERMK